jgi:hypothetical protein
MMEKFKLRNRAGRRPRHAASGVRLLTRNGNDFTARYPLIVEAVNALPVRACVIDGEAVACDGDGLGVQFNEHITVRTATLFCGTPAHSGSKASRSGWGRVTSPVARATGSSSRTPTRRPFPSRGRPLLFALQTDGRRPAEQDRLTTDRRGATYRPYWC